MTLSNVRVAGLVCATASVVSGVWMSWGYNLHLDRMRSANRFERELAKRIEWDMKKYPLHAFAPHNLEEEI